MTREDAERRLRVRLALLPWEMQVEFASALAEYATDVLSLDAERGAVAVELAWLVSPACRRTLS